MNALLHTTTVAYAQANKMNSNLTNAVAPPLCEAVNGNSNNNGNPETNHNNNNVAGSHSEVVKMPSFTSCVRDDSDLVRAN